MLAGVAKTGARCPRLASNGKRPVWSKCPWVTTTASIFCRADVGGRADQADLSAHGRRLSLRRRGMARAGAGAVPVVFEAIGVPGIIDDICRAVPSGTRITIVGVCMEDDTFLPLVPVAKELQFQFVIYYDGEEFGSTLRALAEGEIDPSPMITGVVGIDGVPDAFAELGHPEGHAKVIVEPGAGATITSV